ncbi:kinetochore protein spc24-like [Oculina patagonica]
MSFKEALATPNEVITVLASAEDEEVLEKVANIYNDIQDARSVQQESVKSTLRGLSKILAQKEEEEKASRIDENSKGVETLQVEKDSTIKHIEKLEADVKVFEKKITGKEDEIKELMEKATEVKTNSVEVLPQTKYNFSLYTNVSHIRWDYECEEDQVKGFIANLNDVKPFCFNKSEKSKYEMVNSLWDLLEA